VSTQLDPGTNLAAAEAMRNHEVFNRDQVAYLMHLAYETGRVHGWADDMADMAGTWQEHAQPRKTREDHIRRRLDEMEAAFPSVYTGGPVDWETGKPPQVVP
jgi:hypothetical protein